MGQNLQYFVSGDAGQLPIFDYALKLLEKDPTRLQFKRLIQKLDDQIRLLMWQDGNVRFHSQGLGWKRYYHERIPKYNGGHSGCSSQVQATQVTQNQWRVLELMI